jgi:hypothetical protein
MRSEPAPELDLVPAHSEMNLEIAQVAGDGDLRGRRSGREDVGRKRRVALER